MNNRGPRFSPRTRRAILAIPIPDFQSPRRMRLPTTNAQRHVARRLMMSRTNSSTSNIIKGSSEVRDNIRVVVRVRPPNSAESVAAHRIVVEVEDENVVVFDPKESYSDFYFHGKKQNNNTHFKRFKDTKFVFDRVFSQESSNMEVFQETIQKNLDSLLEGFNCSIFAYGATGSGKTFTMLGSGPENPGLTLLTVTDLYERLDKIDPGYASSVSVSYLEIYNETVRDLLKPDANKPGGLHLMEDANGVTVPSLTTITPQGQYHLLSLLSEGNRRRTQHPTDHNSESSRSHAVFQVNVTIKAKFEDMKRKVRNAKLVMVDLAGSERASATLSSSDRSREGASINRSLLALGNCINALADGKSHVPYRDSKLTRLLKYCLGGNCKSIIIANVSPSSLSYDDTHNTLKYADRAKHIRVNVKKNEILCGARLGEYSRLIQELQSQVTSLQSKVDLYANCTCISLQESDQKSNHQQKPAIQPLTNGTRMPLGPSQSDNTISSGAAQVQVQNFKNLKRKFHESSDSLSLLNRRIGIKKSRMADMEKILDLNAIPAARRLHSQLLSLEATRNVVESDCGKAEEEMTQMLKQIPETEVATIPRQEFLRLNGLEAELKILQNSRDRHRDFLTNELERTYNLLSRHVQISGQLFNRGNVPVHDTLGQAFIASKKEFFGLDRHVRFADEDKIETDLGEEKENLNTTFVRS